MRLAARIAPLAAGLLAVGALAARHNGWPRLLIPMLLGVGFLAAALGVWAVRRVRASTQAAADRVDRDASLGGALSSAHWFATRTPPSDDASAEWVSFHIDRAVADANRVEWPRVYARPRTGWSWTAAVALSVVALLLSIGLPARAERMTPQQALAAGLSRLANDPNVPVAARLALSELMDAVEADALTNEQLAQASALIDVAALDPATRQQLQKLLSAAARQQQADAAQPAKRTASPAGTPTPADASEPVTPDEASDTWAMDERAAKEANDAAQRGEENKGGSAAQMAAMPSSSDRSGSDAAGAQTRDATSALGASQMMIGDVLGDLNGATGASAGGPKNDVSAPNVEITLAAALRREVIEAHDDIKGEDVKNLEHRRRAEQAASALALGGAAARQTFDRARVEPAPPVPEGRRALLEGYFTRK